MPFELLSQEDLCRISGKSRHSAQKAWFRLHFGIEPVCRSDGSIVLTRDSFEALLAKRLNVLPATKQGESAKERPKLIPLNISKRRT
ncbi:DUF4224 domain-containing protein [Paraburkholderia solisilvae]|uniref:Uncharacterized protein n=1 Tax=Paraburkholderia solisilvae TaxID=624376 RepID=A0A6J5E311_9BURK|nr:DUF4224 domain-containing protein [Paraburkholderia solisilvae]CAB3759432.1 hypothetical protein LMG29739_03152 [Paraburkholderia solisilvae]